MANEFLTVQEIAMEAMAQLQNNLVMTHLVHRDFENEFKQKGDTIQVRKPATLEAKEFAGTVEYQDIKEDKVLVTLDKIATVDVPLTSKELTLNIQDFGQQVIQGAIQGLAQKIDADICKAYAEIPYTAGMAGQTPADLTALAEASKILNINKAPMANRRLVVDPEAHAHLVVNESILHAEKSGSTQALRDASLGRLLGFDTYMNQNIQFHSGGSYGFLQDVTATGTKGTEFVTLTSAAGTSNGDYLVKGDILYIGGDVYTVAENTGSSVDGVLANVRIAQKLSEDYVGASVLFTEPHVANMAFHKDAIAFVNRPLALPVGGATGYVINYNGISIRVTMSYDMNTKRNLISFDTLYGIKVLEPKLACRLLG